MRTIFLCLLMATIIGVTEGEVCTVIVDICTKLVIKLAMYFSYSLFFKFCVSNEVPGCGCNNPNCCDPIQCPSGMCGDRYNINGSHFFNSCLNTEWKICVCIKFRLSSCQVSLLGRCLKTCELTSIRIL